MAGSEELTVVAAHLLQTPERRGDLLPLPQKSDAPLPVISAKTLRQASDRAFQRFAESDTQDEVSRLRQVQFRGQSDVAVKGAIELPRHLAVRRDIGEAVAESHVPTR